MGIGVFIPYRQNTYMKWSTAACYFRYLQKVLTRQLGESEEDGTILGEAFFEISPRVEYRRVKCTKVIS